VEIEYGSWGAVGTAVDVAERLEASQ